MKPHVSEFERGRNIVRILLVLAIIFGIAAMMFTKTDSREQVFLVLAAFACVIAIIVVARSMCVCPHCGKRIVNGVLVLKVCPKCKHSLISGAKIKNRR